MKRILAAACLCVRMAGPLAAETFKIDPSHSSVTFRIRHFVSNVQGRFNKFEGSFDYVEGKPASWAAKAKIDAASINTDQAKRDEHLRSADFFDTEKCPSIEFSSSKATDIKGGKGKLLGSLTLHCVTKPVALDLEFGGTVKTAQGVKAGAVAKGTINRKDFGIVWNKTLDSGALILGEDVEITIDIEGNKEN